MAPSSPPPAPDGDCRPAWPSPASGSGCPRSPPPRWAPTFRPPGAAPRQASSTPPPSWAARQASQRCSSSPPSPPAPPDMEARARSSPGPPPRPSPAPVHWPSPSSGNQDCNQRLRPPYGDGRAGLRVDVPALAEAPAGHAQPRQDRRQIPGCPRPCPIRAQDDHVKVAEKTSLARGCKPAAPAPGQRRAPRRPRCGARSGLTVGQFLQVLAQGCVDFLLVVAHPEPGGSELRLLDVAGRDRPVRRHAPAQRPLDPGDELVDLGDLVSGS